LQFYAHGIFDDCNDFIDHAVLLVGYKSGTGWKLKNSWGSNWGEDGYAWIK
jgi:C1A family cysteine protease